MEPSRPAVEEQPSRLASRLGWIWRLNSHWVVSRQRTNELKRNGNGIRSSATTTRGNRRENATTWPTTTSLTTTRPANNDKWKSIKVDLIGTWRRQKTDATFSPAVTWFIRPFIHSLIGQLDFFWAFQNPSPCWNFTSTLFKLSAAQYWFGTARWARRCWRLAVAIFFFWLVSIIRSCWRFHSGLIQQP